MWLARQTVNVPGLRENGVFMRVEVKAIEIGPTEHWSAAALDGLVGQRLFINSPLGVVGHCEVLSARVEDGWVLVTFDAEVPPGEFGVSL